MTWPRARSSSPSKEVFSWGRSTRPLTSSAETSGAGVVLVLQDPRGGVRGGAQRVSAHKLFALLDSDDFHDLNGSLGKLAVHDPICRVGTARLIEIQLETVGEVASTAHVFQPGPA